LSWQHVSRAKPAGATFGVEGGTFCRITRAGGLRLGRYNEARLVTLPLFGREQQPTDERRTVHLAWDLFVDQEPVRAPLEGVVHLTAKTNFAPLDYGPSWILRHEQVTAKNFSPVRPLTKETFGGLQEGQRVSARRRICASGHDR